jgi:hypothetical protein
VRAWWRRTPSANIGIATGAPAGFWVLDVDGEEAEAALAALEAQHGALPVTVQQQTGRGRHLCFRWDPAGPEMRNRSKVGGAAIDVRGNGGYIVAPPSVHPGDEKKGVPPGRIYAWAWGRSPDGPGRSPTAPDWLVELCRPRDQVAAPAAVPGRPAGPRAPGAGGRASRYGEVVLDACVRAIGGGAEGRAGFHALPVRLQGGGAGPDRPHRGGLSARDACCAAGAAHVPDAMTQAQLERQVERAIAWGAEHAWGPDPERARGRPCAGRRRPRPWRSGDGARRGRGVPGAPQPVPAAGRCVVPGCTGWTPGDPGAATRLRWDGRHLVLPLRPAPAIRRTAPRCSPWGAAAPVWG